MEPLAALGRAIRGAAAKDRDEAAFWIDAVIEAFCSGWGRDRHLLATSYKLFQLHGANARLLLHAPVHEHGAFIYDLAFRRDLISNKGLVEAIDLLTGIRNAAARTAAQRRRPAPEASGA